MARARTPEEEGHRQVRRDDQDRGHAGTGQDPLRINGPAKQSTLESFVEGTYLPFYREKWKASTLESNQGRVRLHILGLFGDRVLDCFNRTELQNFLKDKAKELSFSVVDHLRWDLRQIFEMAIAEDLIQTNPAGLLFTPRAAKRPRRKILKWEEVRTLLSALDVRERLIAMLAIVAGMRPGEILALQWKHVASDRVRVRQRIYRGILDTPKTLNSVRDCALSDELQAMLRDWKDVAIDSTPEAWVFPSETLETPIIRDNVWRRNFKPRLDQKGLGWATFQVMRRTHSSLMKDLGVDSKLVADQQGHTLDVNLNVYTRSSVAARKSALDRLENRVFAA